MSAAAIRTAGLAKRYGRSWALLPLDLAAEAGSCLALLGHNGAGKTTLVKLLLGLVRPTAGSARVLDAAPGDPVAKGGIGFLPENIAFNGAMTGREVLTLCARLKGEPNAVVAPLLERVELADAGGRAIRTYSKGMRQRLGLAQALIGRPRLLVLDEPTSGLDPLLRRTFYETIDALKAEGACVLLSSHLLTELEAHADRVAILRRGRLVAHDRLAELGRTAGLPARIRVRAPRDAADRVAAALGGERLNGREVELCCALERKVELLRRIARLEVPIDDVEVTPPSLDDVYAHYSRPGERA